MIEEPEKAIVQRVWTASIPHIANTLDEILVELKKINRRSD
jgi:hypothetical protein